MKVVTAISASRQGLSIKHADQQPGLTHNIASAKYKGVLTKGPGTIQYAVATYRIAISHQSNTKEQDRYKCDLQ